MNIYIKEIRNIEKLYLFYHSSIVTFNHNLNPILKYMLVELNNPKVIISHLINSSDKPYRRIDVIKEI